MNFSISILILFLFCVGILIFDSYFKIKFTLKKEHPLFEKSFTKFIIKNLDNILIFLLSFTIIFLFNKHTFICYNNYSYLTQSLLQGRLDIPDMPLHLEQVIFNGKTYMHFAPGPAILLLPFIAIFGINFNIGIVSVILGALNTLIFYNILKQLNFNKLSTRLWITALFSFGTVHFFLSALGHSWFLGHICATFFLLLSFLITISKTEKHIFLKLFLAGFLFAFGVTCRLPILLSGPLFLFYILKFKGVGIKGVFYFISGAFIPGALYMLYNFVRYNTIMDLGYTLTFKKDYPKQTGGPLQLKFIPYNLYSVFVMAPEWKGVFPYIVPSMSGVSLTFTTPAFFYSLKATGNKLFKKALWVTVILTAIPFLMNYGNGMAQFGMRYAMDFIPFLMLLTASALKELDIYKKSVIMFCIFVNAWGILYWNYFVVS